MATDNGCYFYVPVTDIALIEKALRETCAEMEIGTRDFILLPDDHEDVSIPPGVYIYEDDAYDCLLINDAGLPLFAVHTGTEVLFDCAHGSIPLSGTLIAQPDGTVCGAILNESELHVWPGGELVGPDTRPKGAVEHEEERLDVLYGEKVAEAFAGASSALTWPVARAAENPYQLYFRPECVFITVEPGGKGPSH